MKKISITAVFSAIILSSLLLIGCKAKEKVSSADSEEVRSNRGMNLRLQRPHVEDPELQKQLLEEWERRQKNAYEDTVENNSN